MIIIGLKSAGLGNCMFQYAAAKSLAIQNDTIVKFDVINLNKQQMPFERETNSKITDLLKSSIGVFNVNYKIANKIEVEKFKGWIEDRRISSRIKKKIRNITKYYPVSYFREKRIHEYDSTFFDNTKDTYLEGTFINPKYFENVADVISKEFRFKSQSIRKNKDLLEEIQLCNSVSIHVRRGDYVNNKCTRNIYPVYGIDYYKKATQIISKKTSNLKFFIFSDDIKWVKDNFNFFKNSTIVDHNGINKGYEDLRLMMHCKHNIITNSTFSWWAAWLNTNTNKIVIVPRKWRNDDIDTSDLLLDSWIII